MSERPAAKETSSSYHHGDLAQAALETAVKMLEAKGPKGLVLRQIAAELGVTHKAIYRHYADKETLLAAVAAYGYRALADAVTEAEPSKARFCAAYIDFALARSALYAFMMESHAGPSSPALNEAIRAVIDIARQVFEDDDAVKRAWIILHGGLSLHGAGALRRRSRDELNAFLCAMI
ncbi:MAG: TetR/AcrR family transcriptional regulator [Myxococcota bacterium]